MTLSMAVNAIELERAKPADAGLDPARVLAYVEALDRLHCHSLMILRRGRVVVEGWWHPYRPEDPHILYSVSKSFVSVAVGFAVQEGLLSLDERLVDIFAGQYPCLPCDNMREVRLRDLLTMTMGHKGKSDLDFLHASDWLEEGLRLYLESEPGTNFFYDNRCTFLTSVILQRRAGMTVHEYLTPRLFEPLGMADTWWEVAPSGHNPGGWGLRASTESIARFGQFLLQRGAWGGKQLLSAGWLKEATACHADSRGKSIIAAEDCWRGYGYFFWRSQFAGAYRCDGALGQTVIVMPEQEMVVAMTAGNGARAALLERTWDTLAPGIDVHSDDADEVQERLDVRLASLSIPVADGTGGPPEDVPRYSGVGYAMAHNPLGITRLAVAFGEVDTLCLWLGEAMFKVKAGHGRWVANDSGIQLDRYSDITVVFHKDVAASAAWMDNEYMVKLAYTRTPFVDTLRLRFDEHGVVGSYVCHPVFGARFNQTTLMGRVWGK